MSALFIFLPPSSSMRLCCRHRKATTRGHDGTEWDRSARVAYGAPARALEGFFFFFLSL